MLVWLDLEMTGLDHRRHRIVEIATVITDDELTVVATGPSLVIGASRADLEAMDPEVHKMHTATGLLDEIGASQITVAEAQERTLAFVTEHVPEPRTTPLCGNSIGTDRRFLDQYMPALEQHLHYRVIDVSSVKELAKRWRPEVAEAWADLSRSRAGTTKHRALDDVLESIDELRFYREQWLRSDVTEPAAGSVAGSVRGPDPESNAR
ncbi:oligoribonuclease [Candidatus Poriferisodalis sp.]|uniref:oligoribonuclease n=1 Tax=Candidatus Poriferisodalis sp. TaxID=3101277 RepID=UPI003B5A0A8B